MNETLFSELSAWMTQAGLAGTPETDLVSVFCDRCVAAGIPLGRVHVFIDTLHPVYEGRLFRWGYSPNESSVHEYGRTSSEGLDVPAPVSLDVQATEIWRRSPFYTMLQTGASLLRRRLNTDTKDEFSLLPEWLAAGMTDYVAIITRFAPEGVIGEMDGVYSSWATDMPAGFSDGQIAKLVGTTKPTINAVRDRTHRNMQEIKPQHPVTLGLCTVAELDDAVARAQKKRGPAEGEEEAVAPSDTGEAASGEI